MSATPKKKINHKTLQKNQRQAEVLIKYADRPTAMTLANFFRSLNISRNTFYDWMREDPDFRNKIEAIDSVRRHEARDTIPRKLPDIISIQVQKALEGDTAAAEFCCKVEKLIGHGPEVQLTNQVQVSIDQPKTIEEALERARIIDAQYEKWEERIEDAAKKQRKNGKDRNENEGS